MNLDPLSLLLAIVILGFLIAIHEAGHMLVARWVGMRVLRFSIGFGPVLWRRSRGETTYQLAAVPFGGFVEIDGMNPQEEREDPDDPKLYDNRPNWARALVIFAGPLTNYLFAFLFAAILYLVMGTAARASEVGRPYDLTIESVVPGQPADKAGLRAGDVITHLDGYPVKRLGDYYTLIKLQREGYRHEPEPSKREALGQLRLQVRRDGEVQQVVQPLRKEGLPLDGVSIQDEPGGAGIRVTDVGPRARVEGGLSKGDVVIAAGERTLREASTLRFHAKLAREGFYWAGRDRWAVKMRIRRGDDRFTREVKPDEQTGKIGVRFADSIVWVRRGAGKDLMAGLKQPVVWSRQMLVNLGRLVGGDKEVAASAQGPVGIVREVQNQLQAGPSEALLMVILLSVLLGLFNLLPIPALDGGRVAFRLVEMISRRRINPRTEMKVHYVGLLVLLALILLLTVKDVKSCLGF